MNRARFELMLSEQFRLIAKINDTKGVEYSGHTDVLSDFRAVAKEIGITEQQALMTYATKHWRAINSFVQTGEVKSEPVEGRVHDLILYMLLLLAMTESNDNPNSEDIEKTTRKPEGPEKSHEDCFVPRPDAYLEDPHTEFEDPHTERNTWNV